VADRDEKVHETNLFDMDSKYADGVRVEEVLSYLEGLLPLEVKSDGRKEVKYEKKSEGFVIVNGHGFAVFSASTGDSRKGAEGAVRR